MIDVSIVTPTYNRAHLLPRAWCSLKCQSPAFEWIVVDDGSQDDTKDVVHGLADPRIIYCALTENRGVNVARNLGAARARGRYLIFLDSDDELYPGSLARMVNVLDEADDSIGVAMFLNVMASLGRPVFQLREQMILGEKEILSHKIRNDMICIYRRRVFSQFSLPEDIRGCEYLFLCDISRRYKFLVVPEIGSIVHRQEDNLSNVHSSIARSADMAAMYERILEKHSDFLKNNPSIIHYYLIKAMYRYAVAGDQRSCLTAFRRLIASRPCIITRLKGLSFIALSYIGADKVEAWRIHRLNSRFLV